jgi:hypothetical protein
MLLEALAVALVVAALWYMSAMEAKEPHQYQSPQVAV